MTSPSAVIDRIHVSMLNVGIVCTVLLVLDGLIHRFNIPGDKPNSQNGWYVGFTGNIQLCYLELGRIQGSLTNFVP